MTEKQTSPVSMQGPMCPIPHHHTETVVIGHGSGGQMTSDLIKNNFQSRIGNTYLAEGNDAARLVLDNFNGQIAVSTDSHVVSPIFYPGGDIGRLAVCGTVNDVAMLGAEPKFLTAGFILEEGFPIESLNRVIDSIAEACIEAGVQIVAGDTKVVEKGKADGIFINTAGFGVIPNDRQIGGQFAQPGDAVIISGTLGDHGIAVLQARGELGFESEITSDVAPLNHMIADLLDAVPDVHVLRDPTRGGLGTSLKEIACQSEVSIHLEEEAIPVLPDVRTACELLGFDPLYLANEGKLIVILPEENTEKALNIIKSSPYGVNAMRIGTVFSEDHGMVLLNTAFGSTRIIDMLSGEILPRIC
ncbi:MAG: hydrogenase expression/formation protein HypE [Brevefilum sp.]|nr:hydrogenase expression/formation protein HypE [Brevefilum sp.]MDT8381083.1 hydrogenase expression/formation protein HypE [Brevefilum sp.]MDW7754187.1 hydrogenase expression/formation protein HypE [Brevefilum sp.]